MFWKSIKLFLNYSLWTLVVFAGFFVVNALFDYEIYRSWKLWHNLKYFWHVIGSMYFAFLILPYGGLVFFKYPHLKSKFYKFVGFSVFLSTVFIFRWELFYVAVTVLFYSVVFFGGILAWWKKVF